MDLKPLHIPLIIILIVVLSPLIVFYALIYAALTLYIRIWAWIAFRRHGKTVLFVYSNNPSWQEYIETHILPVISEQSYILNWSERKTWSWSQKSALNYCLGSREFCPAAVKFSGLWKTTTILFFGAFKRHKKGHSAELLARERELRECIQTAT
ncbi:MAG: hypothetical protein KDF49_11765 [Nitrosomonas sp.]|nr:hypothetical protein [Nitrosomonas sp.]